MIGRTGRPNLVCAGVAVAAGAGALAGLTVRGAGGSLSARLVRAGGLSSGALDYCLLRPGAIRTFARPQWQCNAQK